MWRRTTLAISFVLTAALAAAQALPARPKAPVLPKAPALPAAPVLPDRDTDLFGLEALKGLDALKDLYVPALAVTVDSSLMALNMAEQVEAFSAFDLQDLSPVRAQVFGLSVDGEYERGTSSLDSGRYDRAIEAFDKVIAKNGKKADGAMYWKAYALNRLGKRDEALRTLDELQKKFPSSRWNNDAKALAIGVRQAAGQAVSPENAGDEELKLIALNGIMQRDPDRAIPMIEQLVSGTASPKLKERALFVLAQSASPRARTLLADVAKGKGNPDLQLKALDYLGAFGSGPDVPLLVDVYKTTGDIDVKKRVIRSLAMTGRRGAFVYGLPNPMPNPMPDVAVISDQAMNAAREALDKARADLERDRALSAAEREQARAELRLERDRMTGRSTGSASSTEREKARAARAKEASDALWQLYQVEPSAELKREILQNMRFSDHADRLAQIAKTDPNADLRQAAIRGLLYDRSPKSAETILGIYRQEKDPAVRRQIIDAMSWGSQGSAATLVQMARQEPDAALRKRIVERLSTMKDKEAVDYMMEILKK